MLKLIKDGWKYFTGFKNGHISYENFAILNEFTLCFSGTNAAFERVFSFINDFWTSEKSKLIL